MKVFVIARTQYGIAATSSGPGPRGQLPGGAALEGETGRDAILRIAESQGVSLEKLSQKPLRYAYIDGERIEIYTSREAYSLYTIDPAEIREMGGVFKTAAIAAKGSIY